MVITELEKILKNGESNTIEFKSWHKAKNMRERIALAVNELVAFANSDGGTVFFGVEDDGTVTGCTDYNCQNIIEAIYDKTRPCMFTNIEAIDYKDKVILAITVKADGTIYSTADAKYLKRLGKNSKPFHPGEVAGKILSSGNVDFSSRIIEASTEADIDNLEVYKLKEKIKLRDPDSTLPDLSDHAFLNDLGLIKSEAANIKLTVAGLLFIGKEQSIAKLMPQAEVIYLHYSAVNMEEYDARIDMKLPIVSVIDRLINKLHDTNKITNLQVGLFRLEITDFSEKVFQEALLNALCHRDYQTNGAVYVKHYPDKIVIENPGSFVNGITEKNIITHPSLPRNKLIAETLQRLKYVQRTGQGVDIIFKEMLTTGKPYPLYQVYENAVSLTIYNTIDYLEFVKFIIQEQETRDKAFTLSELIVLRYLSDNKKIMLNKISELTQTSLEEARKTCIELQRNNLIELSGKSYMLTPRVYQFLKSDIEYTKDKSVIYIKAKAMILEYLKTNDSITNSIIQELCGFTKQQARMTIDKMRKENLLSLVLQGRKSKYIKI